MSTTPDVAPPLSRPTLLAYGIGQFAWASKDVCFHYFLFFYYTQFLGLSASLAGFAAMLALIARAQKAEMTRAAFEHERDQLIARAKQEARAGAASQADFDAAKKSMAEVVAGQGSDLRSKHQRAMNALISRAQDAGMSREAFERQRDELMSRARREARAGG